MQRHAHEQTVAWTGDGCAYDATTGEVLAHAEPRKGERPAIAGGPSGGGLAPTSPTGATLAQAPDSAQGPRGVALTPVLELPAGLGLTRRQLLSKNVEERRRDLLANERHRWGIRAADLALTVMVLAHQVDRLNLGGCGRTAAEVGYRRQQAFKAFVYACRRVRSLSGDLGPRVASCGSRARYVRCGCNDGEPIELRESCRQRLVCARCREEAAGRTRKRLLDALDRHREAWRDERNRLGALRMLTLTVRHSGDLARDRERIYRGWMELRKEMWRWWGRAFPFCLVWEWTPGEDGKGHVHAHVLVVGGPRFWNYQAINATWRKKCRQSTGIDIQWVRNQSTKAAANYVAKYVAKGSALDDGMTEEVQAQTLAASYGKRSLSTSLGFWAPPSRHCRCCGHRFRPTRPRSPYHRFPAGLPCRRLAPVVETFQDKLDDWEARASALRYGQETS